MNYLFVLGKNPDLSVFELDSYFSKKGFSYQWLERTRNFAVLSTYESLDKTIEHLGGTIKIVKIEKIIGLQKKIEKEIQDLIPDKVKGKYFGLSIYPVNKPHNSNFKLAKKLCLSIKKKTGLKFLPYPGKREFPELIHIEVIKKRLIQDSFEIVIAMGKKKYLGKTIEVHDPFEFKKRDVGRPEQRSIFSIPPRLARIMINLSQCKKGERLLDPFCGLGTIIQEALLEGIDAIGLDIDKEIVKSALNNFEWLNNTYDFESKDLDKRLKQGDSKKLSEYFPKVSFDAIVTEPYLGPPLPKNISRKEAEKILSEIQSLFTQTFREFSKVLKPNGSVVIVIPSIKSDHGLVRMNTGFIKENGFSIQRRMSDYEERHRIIREIYKIKKL
jgi:tRNA G10  N-methylase Trm11